MHLRTIGRAPHTRHAPNTMKLPGPAQGVPCWRRFVIMALSGALLVNVGPSTPVGAAHAATFFCVGDCNLDRTVTIDEILVGVNIALGIRSTHDCPAFDSDGNAAVTIDELVTAVRSALDGCDTTGN